MKIFSAQVEEGKEGKDGKPSVGPVYRNLLSEHDFPPFDPELSTSWDIFSLAVQKYPGNHMLGWRKFVDGKPGPYLWKTYKEVYEEVVHFGSALRASGAEPGSRIGIYGSNCPQWIVAMEACNAHSMICVPLYDTLGPGAVNFIIDHAEIDFVIVQDKKVKELLNPNCESARRLKIIVSFTSLTEEENTKATQIGIKPYSWNEFLQMGKQNPSEIYPPQPYNVCTIMYTSGTSGNPKGVVLTHETIAFSVRGIDLFLEQFEDKMTVDDVYLSFLPLAHILDRMIEEYFFHNGASVGYYHGDLNALVDDLMELKPTLFAGVPRVFEKVYEGIMKALQELNPRRRKIFDILYKYKLAWMNMGFKNKYASPLADLLAFRKIKARLGGRVRLIISGGAPLSSEIEEFLRVTCCAFVVQGYGLTETCGPITLGFPDEMSMVGAVGTVSVYNEMRLEEVPEMSYNPLDNPPCGEICVRGKSVFTEYHKSPELTREAIKDGWFHTGDIGQILPNGTIKIIDRKKNLVKLSQGEYIALEYLENVYGITPIVDDIWVYGNSFKSLLVAVVVLHEDATKKWANLNGYTGSLSELCSLDQLRDHVISELKLTAERNKLRGFESIKGVILEPSPFDMGRDLVTATMKKKRNQLLKYYQVQIDELYRNLGGRSGFPAIAIMSQACGASIHKFKLVQHAPWHRLGRVIPFLSTCRYVVAASTDSLNCIDMLNTHLHNRCIEDARTLFDQNPISRNIAFWNIMMALYIRNDQLRNAEYLFDQMPVKDVVSWNTMLSELRKSRNPNGVYRCFLRLMRTGFRPNEYTISVVLSTVFNVLVPQIHVFVVRLALNSGVFVGSALMRGYADVGDRVALYRVFDEILERDVTSWNALISGYMEMGYVLEAQRVFDLMPEKNIVSWTSLLNGYIENNKINKARDVFNKMSERNVVSWTAMINGYVQNQNFVALPFSCQQVHSKIVKSGIPDDVVLSTSPVDMYAKCGNNEAALCVFELMRTKNLASWNSIIGGCARHGLTTRALDEFERMTKAGSRPNHVTFINLLSACGHGGLIEEGEKHFNSMTEKYGIQAGLEHYACMVDLYGRAGHLEKAGKLIEGMPFEPDVVVWGALLGACGLHSSLELGKFAAKGIWQLQHDHPAVYSMLAKIHGENGAWDGFVELRRIMKEKNVVKQRAASWIGSNFGIR
ncbi:hypothetical protein FNV43_RR23658 [Rhamnella rubrinervis]|uniref:Long-chain-fatty-acid--CoA ligase n=1 Tax=Rhamnella rubrinervis TaxID=2594499 RepID=A0A8K0DTS7_9ROSA|nr:hypothetical protein FNV43_RR23658 [Rhamnella rubrinervis]